MERQAKDDVLLKVEKLEVVYNHAIMAIQGVSIEVPEHAIVAVLGINGAGKTTLLRAISGFLPADHAEITDGEIRFAGEVVNGRRPHEMITRGVVLVPERQKVFDTLTVSENLRIARSGKGNRFFPRETLYEYFPVLKERSSQLAGYLSGGERQMLAIGRALLCQPKLLLLDEFSLGLATPIISQLMEVIRRLRDEQGLTVLIVEQNAMAALKIADYGYVMETGRIVFDGTPQKLLAHEDVKEFYLGIKGSKEKSYREVKQYRRTRRWWG